MASNNDIQNLAKIADFNLDFSASEEILLYEDRSINSEDEDAPLPAPTPTPAETPVALEPTRLYSGNPNSFRGLSESESESDDDEEKYKPNRVSFGSTRNMRTQSRQQLQLQDEGAVAMAMPITTDSEDEDYDNRSSSLRSQDSYDNAPFEKPKGVLKNSKAGRVKCSNALSIISKKYDLDGDGVLDEIEQVMRDADKDGDGQLDTSEVYKIVQSQLKSKEDIRMYRKVAAALVCLIAILALSNFGTSWATAILSRETMADIESGTIQSTNGEVMAFQQITHEIELDALTNTEFEERRKLVDAEMMEDPNHEDHLHRRLGRKGQKNHCSCSKIAYDNGKMKEKDLLDLTYKCDGMNTVSIKRKWKNRDGSEDIDVDTICGPGTTISRKGKRKKNRNKNKVKVVDERVTFKRKGRNGKDKDIHFDCEDGYCFGSGKTLLQGKGHSCNLERERDGGGECEEGLVCYDQTGYGDTGVCVKLQRYARKNQVCEVSLGVDACIANYACYSNDNYSRGTMVGVVETGVCEKVKKLKKPKNNNNAGSFSNAFVVESDVCDASYGDDACDWGYICVGGNGRELDGRGMGYCTELVARQRNGGSCNLANGQDACDGRSYCQDTRFARNGGGNGGSGNNGGTTNSYTSAVISGPSGTIVSGNGGSAGGAGVRSPRTSGMGVCTQSTGVGGTCYSNAECGDNYDCVGLGADTATGGTIIGSSGTIVWGTGGSVTGYCG